MNDTRAGSPGPGVVLGVISDLLGLLASPDPTVTGVARRLGPAVRDGAGNLDVRHPHPDVARALVARRGDTREPSFVRLDLRAPLRLQELVESFGDPRHPPPRPAGPQEAHFTVHAAAPVGATLIAELDELERGSTLTVIIRRDRREG